MPALTDNDRALIAEIHTPGKYAYERAERVLRLIEQQIGHHVYPVVLTDRLIDLIAKLSPTRSVLPTDPQAQPPGKLGPLDSNRQS
jgi:hypothetical protein